MKVVLAFFLLFPVVLSAATLRGVVRAVNGHPVANADVDLLTRRARDEIDREIWTCACETI